MKKTKYRNVRTEIDGCLFDSKKEAARYVELKQMEKGGLISDLELQKEFVLQPAFSAGGKKYRPITYIADFTYTDNLTKAEVIEDVKSQATRKDKVYRIKKKLMAYHGWIIQEV